MHVYPALEDEGLGVTPTPEAFIIVKQIPVLSGVFAGGMELLSGGA